MSALTAPDTVPAMAVTHRSPSRLNRIAALAILGMAFGLGIGDALPNREPMALAIVVLVGVPVAIAWIVDRAGHHYVAAILLALTPALAVLAAILSPLPNGRTEFMWAWTPTLALPAIGALHAALTLPGRLGWPVAIAILALLLAGPLLLPQAATLIQEEVDAGVIPAAAPHATQAAQALYNALFRQALLILICAGIGAALRPLVHR
jgi:hypothetical protein